MNINSYTSSNISTLLQSMYTSSSSSSSSSSMASLTTTVLGGSTSSSGIYSSLGDYNLIKSGSYAKLLKAYYSTSDTESSTSASSTDIFDKLKSSVVSETEDGTVVAKTDSSSDSTSDTSDSSSNQNLSIYTSTGSTLTQTSSLIDYLL